MLASAPPSAFGFLGTPAAITVDHASLVAANGKSLSLVGGAITLNGATLQAAGGEIRLASLASAGEVGCLRRRRVTAFGTIDATGSSST